MALVRARTSSGDEVTVQERSVKALRLTVIDKPAVDRYGRPLPVKRNIHKGGTAKAASEKKES